MIIHSSILAWRIPWTEDPGRLQSLSLQRVGHNRVTEHASMYLLIRIIYLRKLRIVTTLMWSGYSYLRGTNEENKLWKKINSPNYRIPPQTKLFLHYSKVENISTCNLLFWKTSLRIVCFFFFLLDDRLLFHFSLNLLSFHKKYTHTHT